MGVQAVFAESVYTLFCRFRSAVDNIFPIIYTIFILINAWVMLQYMIPKKKILWTKNRKRMKL